MNPAADDQRWLERRYRAFVGREADLRHPTGFREKLLWLNLFHRDPLVPVLADKLTARGVVADRVGSAVLTELLGVWDRPERLPFDRLTEPCVLKVTSGSGWNVFCPDPAELDVPATVAKLRGWTLQNYGRRYREWCYQPLVPRIMAERLMVDARHGRSPDDVKVHCFNGRPRFAQVCYDRRGDRRYQCFGPDGDGIDLGLDGGRRCPAPPPPPDGLEDLLRVAAKLAAGFPYVRVDLYRHQGRTVFGEMTWFPFAGNVPMDDPATDALLGSWMDLPGFPPQMAEPIPATDSGPWSLPHVRRPAA